MAQNEEIALSLQPQPVPADLECLGNLNMTQLLARVAQLLAVVGSGGTQPGQVFPSAVVIATQAKDMAQQALDQIAALRLPQMRFSSGQVSVPSGDSVLSLSWTPDMPNEDYTVLVTFIGASGHPAAYYGYRVVGATITVAGCQISLDNIPANTSLIWQVQQVLPNPST